MPTKIRISSLYHAVLSFVLTHKKGKVPKADVAEAVAAIDRRLSDPDVQVDLFGRKRGVLQNMVVGLLNTLTVHDNRSSIIEARKLLADLTHEDFNPVTVTATGNLLSYTSATVSASAASSLGAIVAYAWTQVGGDGGAATFDTPNAASSAVTLPGFGQYIFQVTATDENGFSASDTVEIISVGE